VSERPNAQQHPEIVFGAQLDKSAQALLALPIEDALLFFVENPEDVGRYSVDSTCLNLEQLLFPISHRVTAIVKLTADDKERPAIPGQIVVGEVERATLPAASTQAQVTRVDGLVGFVDVNRTSASHVE
jgi:hypothetical protein